MVTKTLTKMCEMLYTLKTMPQQQSLIFLSLSGQAGLLIEVEGLSRAAMSPFLLLRAILG